MSRIGVGCGLGLFGGFHWNPASTPKTKVWCHSGAVVLDGSAVVSATDQISTFHLAQAVEAKRPSWDATGWDGRRPCLIWAPTVGAVGLRCDALATTFLQGTDKPYLFAVVHAWTIDRSSTAKYLLQASGSATDSVLSYSGTTGSYYDIHRRYVTSAKTTTLVTGGAPGDGVKHAAVLEFDGTSIVRRNVYSNNVGSSTAVAVESGSSAASQFVLGSLVGMAAAASTMSMKFAEFIFMDAVPTAAERAGLYAWVRRWGLSAL